MNRCSFSFQATLILGLGALAVCLGLLQGSGAGAPLVTYAFTGNTASPTFVAPGVTGNPVVNPGTNAGFSITGNQLLDDGDGATNQGQATTGGDFFEFSFAASNPLDLDTLTLDAAVSAAPGNQRFFVQSSQDGFASDLFLTGNLSNTTLQNFSVDLSSLSLVGSLGIVFRIYSFSNNSRTFTFDNLTINGQFTINRDVTHSPEPASMLAWGLLSGVGFIGYRLRRRKVAA